MGMEHLGMSDSAVAVVTRAPSYGMGSMLVDAAFIVLIIGIGYLVIKKWRERKLLRLAQHSPQHSSG